jgi:hypothetical protein
VLLEAHPDPYRLLPDAMGDLKAVADRLAIGHRVDWEKATQVVRARRGRPEDITAGGGTP